MSRPVKNVLEIIYGKQTIKVLLIKTIVFVFVYLSLWPLHVTLLVYSNVPGLSLSDQYAMRVRTIGGVWKDTFVNKTYCKGSSASNVSNYVSYLKGWSHSYINFETSEPVEVEIAKVNGSPISKATIQPVTNQQTISIAGG